MRRCVASGSRYRRRRIGHHRGSLESNLIRGLIAAAGSLILGACATTSQQISRPPETPASPVPLVSQPRARDQRTLMVDSAASMLGQPYRFGGAEPGGFDCSGLVFYAAAAAGIRVPRTSGEQLAFGATVSRDHLQAGDL